MNFASLNYTLVPMETMIIAQRIQKKYSYAVATAILTLLMGIGGIFLSVYLGSSVGIAISIVLVFIIEVLVLVDIIQTKHHNSLPSDVIVYENGIFYFTDISGEVIVFKKEDVLDMDYKLKTTTFVTANYVSLSTWNYGRLRIWLRIPNNDEECTLLTMKDIAEPDRVVDKIQFIIDMNMNNQP